MPKSSIPFRRDLADDFRRFNLPNELVLSMRSPHDVPLRSGRTTADLVNEGGDVTKRCGIFATGGVFLNV